MKVTIDSLIRLQDVPQELLQQIKAELTIKNPDYVKKKAMGLNRYVWGPEYIRLWSERNINGKKEYILPRGYYARLWEVANLKNEFIDDSRILRPEVIFPKAPTLRDYQEPAIKQAKAWQQGVILMPCGAGKTHVGIGISAEIGQPTLWIAHRMELIQQAMDRSIDFFGLKGNQIGLIQGKNMQIGTHITFATVQTLYNRDLNDIRNKFGCVIVDEAHQLFMDEKQSRMFSSVVSQFPAFYRFGLTASEYRSDGLIETMFRVIGPKIYEIAQDDPRLSVMKPRVKFIETDFEYAPEDGEMLNTAKMVAAMRKDHLRNNLLELVLINHIHDGDFCLVLGDSLEHLKDGQFIVKTYNKSAAFVCGTTPKREREKIIADMRAGKYQYLFATYQLAKLGLDIPRLNKLVLATPKRDKTSVQQAVGRIMRPAEGKVQPVVYDIWDSKVPQLRYWARERVKVYRTLGAEIIGGPKVRM